MDLTRSHTAALKRMIYSGAVLAITKLVGSLSRAVYAVVLARYLGAEMYGEYNYALSWYVALIPLAVFGTDYLILRQPNNETSSYMPLLRTTLSVRLGLGLVLTAISIMVIDEVGRVRDLQPVLVMMSVAIIGRSISLWCIAVCTSCDATRFVLILEVTFRLLELVVGALLLYNGFGLLALATLHAMVWTLQGLVSAVVVKRLLPAISLFPGWASPKLLIGDSVQFLVGGLALAWIFQAPLLLQRTNFNSSVDIGILALSLQIIFIATSLTGEVANAAMTALASMKTSVVEDLDVFYTKFVLFSSLVIGAIFFISAIYVGQTAVNLVFGPEYALVSTVLPWVGIVLVPSFWIITLTSVLVAKRHYTITMYGNVAGAATVTLLCLFWTSPELPQTGIIALLAGSVVAGLATLINTALLITPKSLFRLF